MKIIVLIIFFVFSNICAFPQVKNSLQEQKLKGNILSVTEKVFVANDTILRDDNKLFSKTISRYNEKGFLTGTEVFNKNEKLICYDIYKYDTIRGLKIEDKSMYPDSTFKERSVYKYDEHGNMIEERVFEKKDSLKPAVINRYDLKTKEEPEFDSDEEKIEIVITTKHKNIDRQGNWHTEITFEKKVPISITTREIEYFIKSDEIEK